MAAADFLDELIALKKEDLVLIGCHRGLHTPAHLWAQTMAKLRDMIGITSADEDKLIQAQRDLRQTYVDWKKDALDQEAKRRSLPYSGRTRGGIIDLLLASPPLEEIVLDSDQAALIEHWDDPELYVSAGPGAGKTLTLCALAGRIMKEKPDARILMIAYNVEAESTLQKRLRRFNVSVQNKRSVVTGKGCFVLTFDKWIYHSRQEAEAADIDDVYEDCGADLSVACGAEAVQPLPVSKSALPQQANFRKQFEDSLVKPMDPNEYWDWIILDEAQDIQPNHAAALVQLRERATHFIAAGDPRQEIYSGATWFARKWAEIPDEKRFVLRYNHRSSRTVVEFLNNYSRKHFPNLHHDQIATRDLDGTVDATAVDDEDSDNPEIDPSTGRPFPPSWLVGPIGDQVADALMQSDPGQSYAILPVTVKKYRSQFYINRVRQKIYEIRPSAMTRVFNDSEIKPVLDTTTYVIASAYKLKGTERPRVVVFHTEAPYLKYGVPRNSLLKLIFVALSRARDHLHVVLKHGLHPDDFLYGLVDCKESSINQNKRHWLPRLYVSVTDDLAGLDCWPKVAVQCLRKFTPIDIEVRADADFVGHYMEARLVEACGGTLCMGDISYHRAKRDEKLGLYQDEKCSNDNVHKYKILVDPRKSKEDYDQYIADLEQYAAELLVSPVAYRYAALQFIAQIGTKWTVSERLGVDIALDLSQYTSFITEQLDGPLKHAELVKTPTTSHRSPVPSAALERALLPTRSPLVPARAEDVKICGEFDLSSDTTIIEVKHAVPTQAHINQTAIYATMAGFDSAILLNTKTGTAELVPAFNHDYVINVARAYYMLGIAGMCANGHVGRIPHAPSTNVYISLDIETDGGLNITEFGAVAFVPGSCNIVGVYHDVLRGIGFETPGIFDTGLCVANARTLAADQRAAKRRFQEWALSVSSNYTGIHWAGSEKSLFGDMQTIDVYERYRTWLHKIGTPRKQDLSMSDAISHVLGPKSTFVPHRAFEDAIACAAVFNVICDMSGTV